MGCGLPTDFCICVDLRKGAQIIGICCMTFSFISSIFLLIYLCSDFDQIAQEISDSDAQMVEQLNDNKASAQVTASFLLAILILFFIASLFLFKGVQNKSKKQLFPFLVATIVLIVSSAVIAILQHSSGAFYAVLTLFVVLIYFFLCVYSLYDKFSVDY